MQGIKTDLQDLGVVNSALKNRHVRVIGGETNPTYYAQTNDNSTRRLLAENLRDNPKAVDVTIEFKSPYNILENVSGDDAITWLENGARPRNIVSEEKIKNRTPKEPGRTFTESTPEAHQAAVTANPHGVSMSDVSPEGKSYQMRVDGKPVPVFYSINPDGEISGVVNNSKGAVKGAAADVFKDAASKGGTYLTAWDVKDKLPAIYRQQGFETITRMPYDEKTYGPPSKELQDSWKASGWKPGDKYPTVVRMEPKSAFATAPGFEHLTSAIYDHLEPDEREYLKGNKTLQHNVMKQYYSIKPSIAETTNAMQAGAALGGWWRRYIDVFHGLVGDDKTIGGKPPEGKLLYHYTEKPFDNFDPMLGGKTKDFGTHLGSVDQAHGRAKEGRPGAHIRPVYADIKNPVRLTDNGDFLPHHVAGQLKSQGVISYAERKNIEDDERYISPENLRTLLESKGYDGAVYLNRVEGTPPNKMTELEGQDLSDEEFKQEVPTAKDLLYRSPPGADHSKILG